MTEIRQLDARVRGLEIMVQVLMAAIGRENPNVLDALSETMDRVWLLGEIANDNSDDQAFIAAVGNWMTNFVNEVFDRPSDACDRPELGDRH